MINKFLRKIGVATSSLAIGIELALNHVDNCNLQRKSAQNIPRASGGI
jgi:hypothetical protein